MAKELEAMPGKPMPHAERLKRARAAKAKYAIQRERDASREAQRAILSATRKREGLFAQYDSIEDHGSLEALRIQQAILTLNSQIRQLEGKGV